MTDESPQKDLSTLPQPGSVETLRQILLDLGPYRPDLILIGGWVPYLYQRFGGFSQWQVDIARTVELDLFIPSRLETSERPTLVEILEGAGFEPIGKSDGAVWARKLDRGEVIEFFTAHHGTARQIGRAQQIGGQADLAGISLMHLALLTNETRTLEIGPGTGMSSVTVRVPTLGGYVLNKALTFMDRLSLSEDGIMKAAKDVAYLRDVMAGGEAIRAQVRLDIARLVKRNKSRINLVKTAYGRIQQLKLGTAGVLPVAAEQIRIQHRFSSEGAAKADLIGYLEILSDLLSEIGRRRRRAR